MFIPDQPIKSHKEDILGRSAFAQSLADALLSYKEKDSLVVGLFGEWGSGKTSSLNMILEYIKSRTNKKKKNKPLILSFNPWNFSDQNNLILQFFNQLSLTLKISENDEKTRNVGDKLQDYSLFFSPTPPQDISFSEIRDQLYYMLSHQPHRILVFMDDIDRLNNMEIKQIFQLIKVISNFPNIIYVISLDKKVVVSALEKVQEGNGQEYLEKMVQVPFEIPLISKTEVEQYLFNKMTELINDIPSHRVDRIYWGNIYHTGLKHFFGSLRDVARYINSLKFSFQMVKKEINMVDFFAITALQIFVPEVYAGIRDNKNLFVGIISPESPSRYKDRELCEDILSKTENFPKELIRDFVTRLFPRVDTLFQDVRYENEDLFKWRKEGRVCSPEMFDTFFRLSISQGTIARQEIENIIRQSKDRDAFKSSLLRLNQEEKIASFLIRLEDYIHSDALKNSFENIVAVLMDTGDFFPEEGLGERNEETNIPIKILEINHQFIHRLTTQKERFEILKRVMESAQESLYPLVKHLAHIHWQHARFVKRDVPDPEELRTVDTYQMSVLEEITLKKIRQWAENGKLAKHRNFSAILLKWIDLGDDKKAGEFVNKMIESDSGLLDFVGSFIKRSSIRGNIDLIFSGELKANLSRLKQLTDLKSIERRLKIISSYPGFKQLEKGKKAAVQEFLITISKNF